MAAPISQHGLNLTRLFSRNLGRTARNCLLNTQSRSYRRPIQVLSSKEAEKLSRKGNKSRKSERPNLPEERSFTGQNHYAGETDENYENVSTIPTDINYETLAEGDKRFGPVIQATKTRKSRDKKGLILLEGGPLISQAVRAGVPVRDLFFTSGRVLADLPLHEMVRGGTAVYRVKMRHMELWSDHSHPPGVVAVCEMPSPGQCHGTHSRGDKPLPLTLVCDDIRSHGHLGTILRSAAAVGCRKVLLTKGCVDVWDPKVLRSGTGSHFLLPIYSHIGWELLGNYLEPGTDVYLADGGGGGTPARQARADRRVILDHQSDEVVEVAEGNSGLKVDGSFNDPGLLRAFETLDLPSVPYSRADFGSSDGVVLVVSGEEGKATAEAKKFVYDGHGERLSLPLAVGSDWLNPAVTASLVLFEARRQLTK